MSRRIVIVDIDGTVANCDKRAKKYLQKGNEDWDAFYKACKNDRPITNIIDLVTELAKTSDIVFFTGRRNACSGDTIDWITKYIPNIGSYSVFFREDGDKRHDTEVKPEFLKKLYKIRQVKKKDIWLILEDRNSMVAKWRELGFTCLQVAEGDF